MYVFCYYGKIKRVWNVDISAWGNLIARIIVAFAKNPTTQFAEMLARARCPPL
jgi:hypothetical protein